MKTKNTSNPGPLSPSLFTSFLAIAAACLSVGSAWTADAQSNLFASINGNAFAGGGSIFEYTSPYTPATRSVFFTPLYQPRGMVFDSSSNLFVATNIPDDFGNEQPTIFKIAPDGTPIPFPTNPALPANFFIAGMATDGAGNIFVMAQSLFDPINNPNVPSTIYKVTPDGAVSPFGFDTSCSCSVPGQSISIAIDGAGNLFASDLVDLIIYKFTPAGVRSIFVCGDTTVCGSAAFPFTSTQFPFGLAFDGSGNLFVSTAGNAGNDTILKFTPDGTGSTVATGLSNPKGLAFDTVGNLFVAEIPFKATGDILEFTPGGTKTVVDSGLGRAAGNGGAEFLAFPPEPVTPVTPVGSNVMVNIGTIGSATDIRLTYSGVTVAGTTTVTPIDPTSQGTLPTGFDATNALAFDITTTATYTTPIIIAFQVPPPFDVTTLHIFHNEGGTLVDVTVLFGPFAPNPIGQTIYASVSSLSPFVIAKETLKGQVQQPINPDGSSVFSVKRGVVPVTFTLTSNGVATCQLPPATISLIRTAGAAPGPIDESTYLLASDKGSNFRVSNCQYVYNLASNSLGVGTYRVNISIGGSVVGSGTFALK